MGTPILHLGGDRKGAAEPGGATAVPLPNVTEHAVHVALAGLDRATGTRRRACFSACKCCAIASLRDVRRRDRPGQGAWVTALRPIAKARPAAAVCASARASSICRSASATAFSSVASSV